MICPKCRFENPGDARFCNHCGAPLEGVCPQCGRVNPEGSKFCNQCGCTLGKAPDKNAIDPHKPSSYTPKFLAEKILTDRTSIEGERKVVTILAADVAHFTAISERMDPEEVHALMDGCFRVLMEQVHRYEGTINQFLGDGIMAIFGAPVTHEDHARRACNAALAIQKALAGYGEEVGREKGIDFRMRIGLNTGKVVVGTIGDDLRMDYTALGDTTNIAFLLQQMAEPGQVVVSESVYRHIKGHIDCVWLGEETLKNRKKPVKYAELQHERAERSRVDVAAEEKTLARFVNRKTEFSMMTALFERVKKHEGQVICVAGEAGQGKSRLVYEFKKRIGDEEALFLDTQCISYGKSIPYYPVVEILRKSFGISEEDRGEKARRTLEVNIKRLDKRLVPSVSILSRLLAIDLEPESRGTDDGGQAKEMTFEALRLLILSGSQVKPMIIVVENLQWIDATSEEFMAYIVESIARLPVLLVLTFRLGYKHPFGSRSNLRQITLDRLSDEESQRLIQSLVPKHHLPGEFIQVVLDKAAGNPLYLEEIIKSLLEEGMIIKDREGYTLSESAGDITIPETIQDIVLARVDRLENRSKVTIQAASVIGREFTLKLLAEKEELERRLDQHVQELKQVELIQEKSLFPDIEYMFKHAVTKDVIYESLLLNHRKSLHRRIAQAIERLYPEKKQDYIELLAYHYHHSDAPEKSIPYLVEAGEKAKSVYANNEGIRYFEQALDLMDQYTGDWEETSKRVHQELGDLFDLVGDYPKAVDHFSRAIGFLTSDMEKAEVLRKIGLVYEKKGDLKKALDFYEQAGGLIDEEAFPLQAGRILMNIGWIHNRHGDYNGAVDFCSRALEAFRREKRDYETALALNNFAVIHEFHGQWDEAEKYNKKSIELMKEIGDKRKLGSFYISLGLLSWKRGDLKKSKNYFKKSRDLMKSVGNTLGRASAALSLGKVYVSEGRLKKAFSRMEESLAVFEKLGAVSKLCQNYTALAQAHLSAGDREKAREYCQRALAIAEDVPYPFDQAEIYALMGRIEDPARGNGDAYFTKSLEIFSSLGRKFEEARVMQWLGESKISQGEEEQGEKWKKEAAAIFKELGVKTVDGRPVASPRSP